MYKKMNLRVFDRLTNKMIEVTKLEWGPHQIARFKGITGGSGGWDDVHEGDFNERVIQEKRKHRYVLIQCTGLKDMNGTEIYEGDIVSIKYTNTMSGDDGKHFNSEVYYNLSESRFMATFPDTGSYRYRNGTLKTSEVVGNIHENPELLQNA